MGQAESFALRGINATNVAPMQVEIQISTFSRKLITRDLNSITHIFNISDL